MSESQGSYPNNHSTEKKFCPTSSIYKIVMGALELSCLGLHTAVEKICHQRKDRGDVSEALHIKVSGFSFLLFFFFKRLYGV